MSARPTLIQGALAASLAVCLMTAQAAPAAPASPATGYSQPPKNVLDVMNAPSPAQPLANPSRDHLLLVTMQDYPAIARVATPFLKLAGVRIEPKNHSRHDTRSGYGITPCVRSLDLVTVADGGLRHLALPPKACPGVPQWSADGQRFAFESIAEDSVELWVGDVKTGALRRIPGVRLNPMFDSALQWMPDQKRLLVKLVPATLGKAPAQPEVPPGPRIQQSDGKSGQSSTYETRDTLTGPYDEQLFDYYGQSQLALVDVASGKVANIGKPALYTDLDTAPDGQHLLVSKLRRPYSYLVTYERFPHDVEVWQLAAKAPVIHQIASLPLAERVPVHGEPLGPRDFAWRQNEAATLVWAEALDGGDWQVKVPARDKVMMQRAPFQSAPVEILRTEQRFAGFSWGERAELALLTEFDQNRHWTRGFLVNVDDAKQPQRLLWDLSTDEKYANPGRPVARRLANGAVVLRQQGEEIFFAGAGASPAGDRPFLDSLNLQTLQKQRLFRSDATRYEQFIGFVGAGSEHLLTWSQSPIDPPNAFLRTLGARSEAAVGEAVFSASRKAVTHQADPTPEVRAIQKRLVKYKRADGVDLSFTLYTPPGYKEGTRVPTILYAYPLDYADASAAGQVSGSQATFTRLRNYRLLLLAGYAIIDNAAFPVIGDPKRAYDNYMEQLVGDAKAAVDEAVRLGVTDPDRVGVTGHSHGALMTANLIAHSSLFRAGVATSGSYNKTLTPFGFQSERRSVWEAPEVYQKVSPFFYADKIKTPLLIVHGEDDANPGTTPLQGVKLFEAIRGNGGTTRLVMLPHEPHWYASLESNEQLIYEMISWFDKYVKNAPAR